MKKIVNLGMLVFAAALIASPLAVSYAQGGGGEVHSYKVALATCSPSECQARGRGIKARGGMVCFRDDNYCCLCR